MVKPVYGGRRWSRYIDLARMFPLPSGVFETEVYHYYGVRMRTYVIALIL